jgi:hypothetical protein
VGPLQGTLLRWHAHLVHADALWRVCVRMVEPDQARARAHIDGAVASAVLDMVSIIR